MLSSQARRVGGGGGGVRGVPTNPLKFLKSAFLGGCKDKKNLTQNNQKTVTGRLHGRLPSLPGLSEKAATFWHYTENSNLLDWLIG